MDENLKAQYVQTMFQFKKLMGFGIGKGTAENKSDINLTELVFMKEIADNTFDSDKNVGLSDIRGYLSISKAAVSQMLGSLEKKGYIIREIDKNNRRNLIVTLTPEGRASLANMEVEFNDNLDKLIAYLGEEDVRQLIKTINRMMEFISDLNTH